MRFGLLADGRTIDETVEAGRRAKSEGFASVWFTNQFSLDALMVAAIVGREVPGIEVGTAVVPTFPRHPHVMAQLAKTAQLAAGGRLCLGIGLSHQLVIEGMFGLSYDKPARHMREYLSTLVPLLREGNVSYAGDVYTVRSPLDIDITPPDVIVAALGPAMLRIAGELSDGTVTWMTGINTLADYIVPTIASAAADAGRPAPRVVAALPVAVGDAGELRQRADAEFRGYATLPSYRAMLDREGAAGAADVAIVGDEPTLANAVRRLSDAGVTDFVTILFGSDDTKERTRAALRGLL
jgi:5,10-methylenetetrahydromethanopterin reductase